MVDALQAELAALQAERDMLQGLVDMQQALLDEQQAQLVHFQLLAGAALEGILIHDGRQLVDLNAALARMIRGEVESLIGAELLDFVAADDREKVRGHIRAGYEEPYEATLIRRDGSTFPAELIASNILHQDRPMRVVLIRDITIRRQMAQESAVAEHRYQMLAENTSDVIWLLGLDGRFKYVSPSVERMRGYTPEEVIADSLADVLMPQSYEIARRALDDILPIVERGERFDDQLRFELEQPHKDGGTIWTEVTTSVLYDDHDQALGILGVSRDITRQREAQQALAKERHLLRTVLDNLPESVYVKDMDGRFILNNAESLRRLKVADQAETLGKQTADFFPQTAAKWDALEARVRTTRKPIIVEEQVRLRDGEVCWIQANYLPLCDDNGNTIGIVGINRDITRQKEAESQRLALAVERERLTMLERFIGDMSHDLKTPLTTMLVSLAVLARTDDPAKQQQHRGILEAQVERLMGQVNNILHLSRLDHQFEFKKHPVDVNGVVRNIVNRHVADLTAHQQEVSLHMTPQPCMVYGDGVQLGRMVENLLLNAITHTPPAGTITLTVETRDQKVRLSVADTGSGISPADLPHIFEPLFRADQARNPASGGMGLGLSIARKIVDAHHGEIVVDSQPGVGSTFTVILPLAAGRST
jgi:PAS domain S-box-containing protein